MQNSPALAHYPSLNGRHVFITGGASGIGAAMVAAFARQQASVSFVDINANAATATLTRLREENTQAKIHFFPCDVTNTEALNASIQKAANTFGNIKVLINNAANDNRVEVEDISPESWQSSLNLNLSHAFYASQTVAPMMKSQGGGSIVNFSSINALFGPKNMAGYITAKAGILGMTKALANELGEYAIRVNAILPGWVATDKQLDKWLTPEIERLWLDATCLKRRIEPCHVARLALFLASDEAEMITSQQFVIDGGKI